MGCGVLHAFIITGGQKDGGLLKTPIVRNQFYFLIYVHFFKGAFYRDVWLTADLGVSRREGDEGGALALLEEEKRLGPPAVNKVDSPTDGLNDRAAE